MGSLRTRLSALALLLCLASLALLTACGERELYGELTEFQMDDTGRLASFVLETDQGKRVGVLLEEDTHKIDWVTTGDGQMFWAAPLLRSEILARCEGARQSFTTQGGERIAAYRAQSVSVSSVLTPSAAVLANGTVLDRVDRSNSVRYQLPDGTTILWEEQLSGPENVYSGNQGGYDDLSPAAQERVSAYYREQGLLYDLQAELERAYADWLVASETEYFSPSPVGQQVVPGGASERVMYFTTHVTLPAHSGVVQERRLSAAFDRETGERIETWDLFSCQPEEAKKALLDRAELGDPALLREAEAAFDPAWVVFTSDGIDVWFPQGSLPSQETSLILFLEYSQLEDILHSWAIPPKTETAA